MRRHSVFRDLTADEETKNTGSSAVKSAGLTAPTKGLKRVCTSSFFPKETV